MKIFYLSSTAFSFFDIDILSQLAKEHSIWYRVLVPRASRDNSIKELQEMKEKNRNMQFDIVNLKYRRRNPLNIIKYMKLLSTIKKENFDIIFLNDFEDIYLRLLCIFLISKNKTIYGIHDVIMHSGWQKNFLLNISKWLFIKKFSTILTFSKSQGEIIKLSAKEVFTIPLAPMKNGCGAQAVEDYKIIQFLFFGYVVPYKGVDVLIKAVNRLSKKYKNFRLSIVGSCPDWPTAYEPLIEDHGQILADIRFIENYEIPRFFSQTHYLILPYKDVTQSGPLMIAYNNNIPVIASRLDGFTEFIEEGITGFTFEITNNNELDQVLEQAILRTKEDYEILKSKLKNATSKLFSIENIALQYNAMFKDINHTKSVVSR